jgi:hypothetical protein
MSNNKFASILMALVAMSCFGPSFSLAQADKKPRAFTPKIKTPDTSKDLKEDKAATSDEIVEERDAAPLPSSSTQSSSAPRRLQQHGFGIGLGQTFLLGDYAKNGQDKITLDLLYSYAASYSFDLLLDAHWSDHEDGDDRMRVMGATGSIKGRFVEYDNFSPYFLGGLGFYAPKARRDGEWTDQKVTFGLNFGGGVDLRLNEHYVVGLLGQMHWPFKVQQDDQSDLTGYYFKMLITGMYLF